MDISTLPSINVTVQNPDAINWLKDFLLPLFGTLIGVIAGALLTYNYSSKLFKNKIYINKAVEAQEIISEFKSFMNSYNFSDIFSKKQYNGNLNDDFEVYSNRFISFFFDYTNTIFFKDRKKFYEQFFKIKPIIKSLSPSVVKHCVDSNLIEKLDMESKFDNDKNLILSFLATTQNKILLSKSRILK